MLREPILRALFLISAVVLAGYGMITVVLVLFVQDVLREGALVFGWLVAAQGIGGLLGAAGTGWMAKAWSPARVIALGLLAIGLLNLLLANFPLVPVDIVVVAVMGLPIAGYWISTTLLLQTRTPGAYRGRVFGAHGAITSLTTLLGIAGAGLGTGLLGVTPAFDVAAGFYFLGGAMALALLPGAERRKSSVATGARSS